MKIAVIGSRDFTNYDQVKAVLDTYPATEYVSGGARGADKQAERYAAEKGIPIKICLPLHDRGEGHPYQVKHFAMRNRELVDYADMIIAFWDGKSKGTKQALEYAESQGKIIIIERI
jgi:hypothetical protein